MTLLQLRVFYAMKDARTPTLIQVGMVAVRVPLLLPFPRSWRPAVVAGLMLATSVTYVAGWVIGDMLLRRRLGALRTGRRSAGAADGAVSAVAGVRAGWSSTCGRCSARPSAGSLGTLLVGTVVIGAAALAGPLLARVPELREPLAAVRARLGRG